MPSSTPTHQDTLAAPSRTGRAFALVLALHAGAFFGLHSVMQTTLPTKLAEAISAHIVTEYKPPELFKPLPPPPVPPKTPVAQSTTPAQATPVVPSQTPTALAQAPSAAPAITAAPAAHTPAAAAPTPALTPALAAPVKPSVVITPSRVESSCTEPRYPSASRRLSEEGVVTLRLLISENGQVVSGQIGKSSGYKRLDDAALAAISLCKFKPATVDGKPKQDWFALSYRWEMKDD